MNVNGERTGMKCCIVGGAAAPNAAGSLEGVEAGFLQPQQFTFVHCFMSVMISFDSVMVSFNSVIKVILVINYA